MKKNSIHTGWLSWFMAGVLTVLLLGVTGKIDFLISKDTIGIMFSIFLVLTLLNACWSQYKSFRNFNRNQRAVDFVDFKLSSAPNFKNALNVLLKNGLGKEHKNTPMQALLTNLKEMMKLNPEAPLSESNIETFEMAYDEAFYIDTHDEVEQAQNLTMLGMLGTFVGICWGFMSIDWTSVTPDNAFIVVIGVMSGISIALITSILGIIFSLFLKKMHKRLETRHRKSFLIVSEKTQHISRILCHEKTYKEVASEVLTQ